MLSIIEENKEVEWRLCENCNLKSWSEKFPLSRLNLNKDLKEEKAGVMLISGGEGHAK